MKITITTEVKYLWRAGLKGENTKLEDLKKARWYLNNEIERLTDEEDKS